MASDEARVRVASCRDPAEVALVRSVLTAHDIDPLVIGEHHAALFAVPGGLHALDVWVDRADAERAAELIRSIREGVTELDGDDDDPDDDDELDAVVGDDTASVDDPSLELRRRTGAALLLSLAITFGTGHMYARAWMRGIALAAIEIIGFGQFSRSGPMVGATIVLAAILTDAIGSTILVRRAVRAANRRGPLPRARVVR